MWKSAVVAAAIVAFLFWGLPAIVDATNNGYTTITVKQVNNNEVITNTGDDFKVDEGVSLVKGQTYVVHYKGADTLWFDRTITSAAKQNG